MKDLKKMEEVLVREVRIMSIFMVYIYYIKFYDIFFDEYKGKIIDLYMLYFSYI